MLFSESDLYLHADFKMFRELVLFKTTNQSAAKFGISDMTYKLRINFSAESIYINSLSTDIYNRVYRSYMER